MHGKVLIVLHIGRIDWEAGHLTIIVETGAIVHMPGGMLAAEICSHILFSHFCCLEGYTLIVARAWLALATKAETEPETEAQKVLFKC